MARNIEMNYKGGSTSYEVIYPKNVTNVVDLSGTMDSLFGFVDGSLEDALTQLFLGTGQYGYAITVLTPNGLPVQNARINGYQTASGEAAITNSDGMVLISSDQSSIDVVVTSPYIDLLDSDGVSIVSSGILTNRTVYLKPLETELVVTNSDSGIISQDLSSFDLCIVGAGGGGGGFSGTNSIETTYKAGGGGGYVQNLLSIEAISGAQISFTVGAGGSAGGQSTTGGAGGQTSVSYNDSVILTAEGGTGGQIQVAGSATRAGGGTGNGTGGQGARNNMSGTAGTDGTGYKYNDSGLGLIGGGGGGGGGASGGQPNGGLGGQLRVSPIIPGYGGGGGGGRNGSSEGNQSAPGGQGVVYFRPHYKS